MCDGEITTRQSGVRTVHVVQQLLRNSPFGLVIVSFYDAVVFQRPSSQPLGPNRRVLGGGSLDRQEPQEFFKPFFPVRQLCNSTCNSTGSSSNPDSRMRGCVQAQDRATIKGRYHSSSMTSFTLQYRFEALTPAGRNQETR